MLSWVCWVLPIEITLYFSGAYEIIEYAVADIFFPGVGTAYLGTQGDVWDAQKDMLIAFTGSIMCMSGTGLMRMVFRRG
jgi:putative membrane protein